MAKMKFLPRSEGASPQGLNYLIDKERVQVGTYFVPFADFQQVVDDYEAAKPPAKRAAKK